MFCSTAVRFKHVGAPAAAAATTTVLGGTRVNFTLEGNESSSACRLGI